MCLVSGGIGRACAQFMGYEVEGEGAGLTAPSPRAAGLALALSSPGRGPGYSISGPHGLWALAGAVWGLRGRGWALGLAESPSAFRSSAIWGQWPPEVLVTPQSCGRVWRTEPPCPGACSL